MSSSPSQTPHVARQQQFLNVIGREEATARFHKHLNLKPLGSETVPLAASLNRVLACDIVSRVDVPCFDRSNMDGFAVQAADTFGTAEERPQTVALNDEVLSPGIEPRLTVRPGTATPIATGAMVPRGADAVVMIEHTELVEEDRSGDSSNQDTTSGPEQLRIRHPVAPGQNIAFAGTDIARGETVLRTGQLVTSREIGVLAAIGLDRVSVYRRPRVAIISTGDEIIAPGQPLRPGTVFDSNAAITAAAVEELGGEPIPMGSVPDDLDRLQHIVHQAMQYDVVILSGGTSKGAGDLSYHVVNQLKDPGIVAHGVALKPGKPICLAVTGGKPVVILPGFPTSAIFTFHEFVAPVIRTLAGRPTGQRNTVTATLPLRVNSAGGRTEYLLVNLVRGESGLTAYPMGKGSGSVTTFSCAEGFLTMDAQTEFLEAGCQVSVQLLGQEVRPADLVAIGSHCVGLDMLLGEVQKRGSLTKALHVGSTGGLAAAGRGECDIAGIHLLDPATGEYNRPLLTAGLELITGYRRMQGIVYRPGDGRFQDKSVPEAIESALNDAACVMVNRNAGSGTRILIDQLLEGKQPPGYAVQAKSHNAVAAAVSQGRADWGLAIDTVANEAGLAFLPHREECYDFVVPASRRQRPAVRLFEQLLADPAIREQLAQLGFRL